MNSGSVFLSTAPNPGSNGYSGAIFVDDICFTAMPPPLENVVVGPDDNNGDLENPSLAPFGGAATSIGIADDDENTPIPAHREESEGNQFLCVDLQGESSGNGRWKGISNGLTAPVLRNGSTLEASFWVYIPEETTIGGATADDPATEDVDESTSGNLAINLEFRQASDPTVVLPNSIFANLAESPRGEWFQITTAMPVQIPDGEDSVLLRNWYVSTAEVEGSEDPENPGTILPPSPEELGAAGYSGNIYFDDFQVVVTAPEAPPEPTISITGIEYQPESAGVSARVTISYVSTFAAGTEFDLLRNGIDLIGEDSDAAGDLDNSNYFFVDLVTAGEPGSEGTVVDDFSAGDQEGVPTRAFYRMIPTEEPLPGQSSAAPFIPGVE